MVWDGFKKLRWTFLAANFFLLVGLFAFIQYRGGLSSGSTKVDLPIYGSVSSFSLTERSGNLVGLENLKNKVWIADFIFTRCGGPCPLMTQKMQALSLELKNVQFVSFSVDPTFDTPEVLKAYAASYGADLERWYFLTGKKESIDEVAVGFHVNKADEPTFHNISFILVDPKGQIRGYYDTSDPEKMNRLKKDVKVLNR